LKRNLKTKRMRKRRKRNKRKSIGVTKQLRMTNQIKRIKTMMKNPKMTLIKIMKKFKRMLIVLFSLPCGTLINVIQKSAPE